MKFLREYRIPLVFYSLFLVFAAREILTPEPDNAEDSQPPEIARPIDSPDEADRVLQELYPNRPEHLFWSAMEDVKREDLIAARAKFEEALESGINTHESLLYNYAVLLVLLGEEPSKVDEAVARWRKFFPGSKLQDPRTLEIGKTGS